MNNSQPDTKTRILDVAQELIQRRGLNAMSFQDLSDAVGIRKASVHHHFANKQVMVNAVLDRYMLQFHQTVEAIIHSKVTGKTKLKRFCDLFTGTLDSGDHQSSCLCGMLAAEMFSLDDQGVEQIRQFFRASVKCLSQMLKEGAKDGSIRKQSNPESTAEMVLASLEGGMLIARCEGGPKRFTDLVHHLIASLSE